MLNQLKTGHDRTCTNNKGSKLLFLANYNITSHKVSILTTIDM